MNDDGRGEGKKRVRRNIFLIHVGGVLVNGRESRVWMGVLVDVEDARSWLDVLRLYEYES